MKIAGYIILGVAATVFVVYVVARIVSAVRSWKNRLTNSLFGGISLSDLKKAISDGTREAENPSPRTLFGATSIYMPKILKDFPDFHMPEARASLNLFLNEYLRIRYGEAEDFDKSVVERDLAVSVPRSDMKAEVTNVNFHDCAVRNYLKTSEYATITYIATIGYSAGDKRFEDRYQVDSTLKLSEEGIPKKLLVCSQCGGSIDTTANKTCPYCGAGIVWDTKLSWRFTAVSEC
jgi:hypothetical protein